MELVAPNSARELFLLCGGSTLGYLPFSLRQGAASPKKGGAFIHVTTLFGMRVGLPTLRKVFLNCHLGETQIRRLSLARTPVP
jgi:hypothetical protein